MILNVITRFGVILNVITRFGVTIKRDYEVRCDY